MRRRVHRCAVHRVSCRREHVAFAISNSPHHLCLARRRGSGMVSYGFTPLRLLLSRPRTVPVRDFCFVPPDRFSGITFFFCPRTRIPRWSPFLADFPAGACDDVACFFLPVLSVVVVVVVEFAAFFLDTLDDDLGGPPEKWMSSSGWPLRIVSSISFASFASRFDATKLVIVPDLPARAVRPDRCR